MMNKNMKADIDSRLSSITVSEQLKHKITESKKPRFRTSKRYFSIAVAVILCVTLSVTVLAVAVTSFRRLLSIVSPQTSDILQPIEISHESDGIKMEVVAAINDDDMAVVYLTMQDMTADRINQSIDLYNYNIIGARGFTHEVIDYDESTKTATIRMTAMGGKNLNGKQVSLNIKSFLVGRKKLDRFVVPIDTDVLKEKREAISLSMRDTPGGSGDLFDVVRAKGGINILKPDMTNIELPNINFAYISNIGVLDNRLHIQVKWTKKEIDKANIDDHGFFILAGSDNTIIQPSSIDFGVNDKGNTKYGNGYTEYVFDIDPTQLSNYELMGDQFTTNGDYIEGHWNVPFEIKAVKTTRTKSCDIKVGNISINQVSVSSLGITLNAVGDKSEEMNIEVSIPSMNTEKQIISKVMNSENDNKFVMKYVLNEPIDVENIKTIYINNTAVIFQE